MSWTLPHTVNHILAAHHYLGTVQTGLAWRDEIGVMVFGSPRSRRLPLNWLELTRWCILDHSENSGSRQWARVRRELLRIRRDVTTIISYSDPSAGHTGALYRACNWWWAPTWHRLRPPPSGNGEWSEGEQQSVKDRWIFPLRWDDRREEILLAQDESILRRNPEFAYREPGGVKFIRERA